MKKYQIKLHNSKSHFVLIFDLILYAIKNNLGMCKIAPLLLRRLSHRDFFPKSSISYTLLAIFPLPSNK